ncbi:unnamed protein product [Victoria cruziana]
MDPISETLVSKLVEATVSFIQKEVEITYTAKAELQLLKGKLDTVKSIMSDAERLPFFEQEKIKSRMMELKAIVYDAEDMMEESQIKSMEVKSWKTTPPPTSTSRNKVRKAFTCLLQCFRQHLSYPNELGHGVKNINEQLARITENFTFEKKIEKPILGGRSNQDTPRDRTTTSHLIKEEVVGREGDKTQLIKLLLQAGEVVKKRNYSIVAIVGKGGLGKTFLAQMICNDERVKQHFADAVWWVCVSEKPNPIDLVKKLLEAITKKDASDGAKDLETLCGKLRDAIKDKRFLLILDDVWDLDWWEKSEGHLHEGAPGSKILITTRNGSLMESDGLYNVSKHDLKEFSWEESWKLFLEKVDETEEDLKEKGVIEIGERIVRTRCGGLPLVIKTVGRLLHEKKSKEEWESVEENPIWSWKKNADDDKGVLLPGLMLSYDALPPHVKNCFVYCSLFPKDFQMEKETLTQQWIAHGLVKEREANDCLNELIGRCLLEDRHEDLRFGCLRMHDVIHDLALYIGDEEYSHDSIKKNTRHLSLIGKDQDSLSPDGLKSGCSKLRTLLCHEGSPPSLPTKFIAEMKRLRVLRMRGLSGSIDKLLHLRYLELNDSDVESMHMLHDSPFLKTLRLSCCKNLKWLPSLPKLEVMILQLLDSLEGWSSTEDGKAVILPCLRTLEIDRCSNIKWLPCLPKVEVMELKFLYSLEGWSSTKDSKAVILPCLKTLNISHSSYIKWLPSLPNVKVMKLSFLDGLEGWSSAEDDDKAVIYPCLRTLEIGGCSNIKWLPCLPKVEVMRLEWLRSLEGWSSTEDGKAVILPCLRTLKISNSQNIKWLPSLPKVEVMELYSLDSLEGWPSTEDGKAVIYPCLRTLEIDRCSNIKWLPCLPKVEVMRLEWLHSLEGWSSTEEEYAVILPCLRELKIFRALNMKWLPCLPKVEVIELKSLPSLEGWSSTGDGKAIILPCVRELKIYWCRNIKWLPCLPKVEVLELFKLPSLEGWSSTENGKAVIFPCLRTLDIYKCSNIKRLPCLPKVEVMELKYLSSLEGWSSTEDDKAATLSCLRSLLIFECSHIEVLHLLAVVKGVLDMRFYIHDLIEARRDSECSIVRLYGNVEEKETFLLELFSKSVSKSLDQACVEIGKTHEHVFQSLQPPHNMETLSLRNYLGKQLPSWLSMDANIAGRLKELNLSHCLMLKVLIHLPVVERMSLEGLWSLEEWSAGDDERAATFPRLKSFKMDDCPNIKLLPFLPLIEELSLMRLPKCKGWPKPVEMPYLRQPHVRDCPHLSCSPSSVNVVPQMRFDGDSDDCWSMIGAGNESPSFPSSSVDELKLWFHNAREEFMSRPIKFVEECPYVRSNYIYDV